MDEDALMAAAQKETEGWDDRDRQMYLGGVLWAAGQRECAHERVLTVTGKADYVCWPSGDVGLGYALPTGMGSLGTLEITVCADCGKVQGFVKEGG